MSIYEELRNSNVCSSAYQFSREFLCRSSSYYSVLKARDYQPTTDVLMTLELALKKAAEYYSSQHYPHFIHTKNRLLLLLKEVREYRDSRILFNFVNYRKNRSRTRQSF